MVILDEAKQQGDQDRRLGQALRQAGFARALVVDGEFDKNFQMSGRNLAVRVAACAEINVYVIMRSEKLVLTTPP